MAADDNLTIEDLQIKISADASSAASELKRVAQELKSLGATASSQGKALSDAARSITDLGKSTSEAADVTEPAARQVSSGLSRVIDTAKKLGRIGVGAFKKSVKTAGNLAGSAITGIQNKLSSLWSSVKRIAFYRLIRSGIKMVTQALKEGVDMLVAWDRTYGANTSRAAKTTDEIAAKWREVKKSLGAAAMPIIQLLQPALMGLLNIIISVANFVNQIARSIQGYGTYIKATEKGFKSTTAAAKELKRVLFGFDELNVLPSNTGSSSSTDVGAIDFEEVGINNAFANSIGDAISGLIEEIRGKLDAFKSELSSGNIVGAVANLLLGIVSGFGVSVGELFKGLGKNISQFAGDLGVRGTDIGLTLEGIGGFFTDLGDLVENIFTLRIPEAVGKLGDIVGDISMVTSGLLGQLKQTIFGWLDNLGSRLGTDFAGIKMWVDDLFLKIKLIVGLALPSIFGTISGWVEDVLGLFENLLGELSLDIEGFLKVIKGIATVDFPTIWSGIIELSKSRANTLIDIIEFIANAFITPFQSVAKALNKFQIDIPDWVPVLGGKKWSPQVSVPQKISIPRFAQGGYVPNMAMPNVGSLFMAGENGAEVAMNMRNGTGVLNVQQMEEAIANGNEETVNAIYSVANMVVSAIRDKNFDIYMDSDKVGQSVNRSNNRNARRFGITMPNQAY